MVATLSTRGRLGSSGLASPRAELSRAARGALAQAQNAPA